MPTLLAKAGSVNRLSSVKALRRLMNMYLNATGMLLVQSVYYLKYRIFELYHLIVNANNNDQMMMMMIIIIKEPAGLAHKESARTAELSFLGQR